MSRNLLAAVLAFALATADVEPGETLRIVDL